MLPSEPAEGDSGAASTCYRRVVLGIGEAFAERLAGDGWDLVVVARRYDRLDALARRLADDYDIHARAIAADLADEAQLNRLLAEMAEIEVGLLVNNAALSHETRPDSLTFRSKRRSRLCS